MTLSRIAAVPHGAGQRPGGILAVGDRQDPGAADEADRRLTVTRPFCVAGDRSEAEVSVPIAAAQSPAATPAAEPELDPPGETIGTPRSSSAGA